MKNRIAIILGGVLVLTSLFYFILIRIPHWSLEKEGTLIKLNRGTGKAYQLLNGGWKVIKEAGEPKKLDSSEADKVTGKAGFEFDGAFKASLYNGTHSRITGMTISVTVKCDNATNNFKRQYYQATDIPPLSDAVVVFNITKPSDYTTHYWGMPAVYGIPELKADGD